MASGRALRRRGNHRRLPGPLFVFTNVCYDPAISERQHVTRLTFENLWVDGRWRSDVTVEVDDTGGSAVPGAGRAQDREACEYVRGLTLPGLASAHCHAFQRILPAWTQRCRGDGDSFWTWRTAMYAAASCMGPAELEAVAARCYLDLLKGGYTGVAEFLYLHRVGAGTRAPDADQAIAAAARRVGLSLTLLPALYQHSQFGRAPPTSAQQRFVRTTPQFLEDWAELKRRYPPDSPVTLGVAFHSLRAVDIETVEAVRDAVAGDEACRALHIHVAEQPAEVADCIRCYGRPPVDLLLERQLPDAKWTLVHGTHASHAELDGVCDHGATLAVCPTTEADLGDGCAKAVLEFLRRGGHLAIGSDSNICRNAYRELRLLEWSQRLLHGRRNVLASPARPYVADELYRRTLFGGWKSLGALDPAGQSLEPGSFVTFDDDAGNWRELPPELYLSAMVFDAGQIEARQVIVNGRRLIRDGAHAEEQQIERDYRAVLSRVAPQLMKAEAT
jgi:formimidoylglutamate deiminase